MKSFRYFLSLTLAILALSFINVNAQSSSSQKTIEQQVFKKINRLPYYGVFDHIAFEVDGGRVTLHGKVLSLGTRKAAESAVKRIEGVTSVVNNIEDLPLSSFDNRIRRQLLRQFANSAGVSMYLRGPDPSVRLIVENGRVTLEGYVHNKGTSNLMNILANGVPGTFQVTNNLIVSNGRDS